MSFFAISVSPIFLFMNQNGKRNKVDSSVKTLEGAIATASAISTKDVSKGNRMAKKKLIFSETSDKIGQMGEIFGQLIAVNIKREQIDLGNCEIFSK